MASKFQVSVKNFISKQFLCAVYLQGPGHGYCKFFSSYMFPRSNQNQSLENDDYCIRLSNVSL